MKFYPIKTNDNTISLYNMEFNDVYHSRVGAYTEALNKYIVPSGLIEYAQNNNSVKILDVCYGLGYNSKTAVDEILKINPEINIFLTALENDPYVLSLSTIISNECFDCNINGIFFKSLNQHIKIDKILKSYMNDAIQYMPQIQKLIPSEYDLLSKTDLNSKLHNIYYRTHSSRKSIDIKPFKYNIMPEFYIADARQSIQSLIPGYDFIFHDPFTPSKLPVLWTVDFFKILYGLLNENGNLTTYSNAAPVRSALKEAGFYIGVTEPIGKKTTGTIAYKKSEFIKKCLSDKEIGILNTRAGIPYRDELLNSTNDEIINNRKKEQEVSDRITTSSYLKSIKYISCFGNYVEDN